MRIVSCHLCYNNAMAFAMAFAMALVLQLCHGICHGAMALVLQQYHEAILIFNKNWGIDSHF